MPDGHGASRLTLAWAHAQVEAVAGRQARPAEVRAQLEEHQRQVARWEGPGPGRRRPQRAALTRASTRTCTPDLHT